MVPTVLEEVCVVSYSTYHLTVNGALKILAERTGGQIILIHSYYNASINVMPRPP